MRSLEPVGLRRQAVGSDPRVHRTLSLAGWRKTTPDLEDDPNLGVAQRRINKACIVRNMANIWKLSNRRSGISGPFDVDDGADDGKSTGLATVDLSGLAGISSSGRRLDEEEELDEASSLSESSPSEWSLCDDVGARNRCAKNSNPTRWTCWRC